MLLIIRFYATIFFVLDGITNVNHTDEIKKRQRTNGGFRLTNGVFHLTNGGFDLTNGGHKSSKMVIKRCFLGGILG